MTLKEFIEKSDIGKDKYYKQRVIIAEAIAQTLNNNFDLNLIGFYGYWPAKGEIKFVLWGEEQRKTTQKFLKFLKRGKAIKIEKPFELPITIQIYDEAVMVEMKTKKEVEKKLNEILDDDRIIIEKYDQPDDLIWGFIVTHRNDRTCYWIGYGNYIKGMKKEKNE